MTTEDMRNFLDQQEELAKLNRTLGFVEAEIHRLARALSRTDPASRPTKFASLQAALAKEQKDRDETVKAKEALEREMAAHSL